jgi:hypothetical protein
MAGEALYQALQEARERYASANPLSLARFIETEALTGARAGGRLAIPFPLIVETIAEGSARSLDGAQYYDWRRRAQAPGTQCAALAARLNALCADAASPLSFHVADASLLTQPPPGKQAAPYLALFVLGLLAQGHLPGNDGSLTPGEAADRVADDALAAAVAQLALRFPV